MADRKDYQFYMLIWRNWQHASGLSPDGGNTVWVRLPLSAPNGFDIWAYNQMLYN